MSNDHDETKPLGQKRLCLVYIAVATRGKTLPVGFELQCVLLVGVGVATFEENSISFLHCQLPSSGRENFLNPTHFVPQQIFSLRI
jgi:hypothetical protein